MSRIVTMAALKALSIAVLIYFCSALSSYSSKPKFRVIAFLTAKEDPAHISFVHEAERWFPEIAAKYNFSFDTTSNWHNLNSDFLSRYQVVVFLDTRPEDPAQRAAFQTYMEHGGAWMGFHFAGFALTPSKYPANWDWYHNTFLGSGSYVSNTWRPTVAILRVEDRTHPATHRLPETFRSSPNEWYQWEKDLRQNPDIDTLLSIDSTSFPLCPHRCGNRPRRPESQTQPLPSARRTHEELVSSDPGAGAAGGDPLRAAAFRRSAGQSDHDGVPQPDHWPPAKHRPGIRLDPRGEVQL